MSRKPPKGEYIETDTGNKVSRKSQIIGTTNIILGGKTVIQAEVVIRGDLLRTLPTGAASGGAGPAGAAATVTTNSGSGPGLSPGSAGPSNVAVAIGRYCFMSRGACLRPPGKLYKGVFSHYPLKIGDHVFIGPGAVIEAALIGNHVSIGAGCVIGKFVIIKDFVRILDGTIVPPNMVIPSFSVVAGRPGRVVGEVPEGGHEAFDCREIYRSVGN